MLHFGLNVALAAYAFVALLWVAQHVGATHTPLGGAWGWGSDNCRKKDYRESVLEGAWGEVSKVYGAYEYNAATQKWDIEVSLEAAQFTRRYEHCVTNEFTEWKDAYNYAVSLSFIWVFYCGNY